MINNFNGSFLSEIFSIPRETIKLLKEYQELVVKWNQKMNLVSQDAIHNLWDRHIVDSLQLIKFINDREIHLADLGSGAGFPGIVMSLAGIKEVTLIESNFKKAAFLLHAASISSNKINIVNDRAENIDISCDIISSRACASVDTILTLAHKYKPRDKYLILKGSTYQSEIDLAKQRWFFHHRVEPSITSQHGAILELRNVTKIVHSTK
ncbi:MAG: 16S rRNA (guanine(527)-N(7))-methyltransferase RsmG [Janthinobacterium lividum]